MAKAAAPAASKLHMSDFFSGAEARLDLWRALAWKARTLADGDDDPALEKDLGDVLAQLEPLEEYFAYPGTRLMSALKDRLAAGEREGFSTLAGRIGIALMGNVFRQDAAVWEPGDNSDARMPDLVPSSIEATPPQHRPYFEVLIALPADRSFYPELRNTMRRLRRSTDQFIYEVVIVGSFEDAVVATLINPNIQSVIIRDGLQFKSHHALDTLREMLTRALGVDAKQARPADMAVKLAKTIKMLRPELDIFVGTDRNPEELAGSTEAAPIRRVFYGLEETLEQHLSIMEGVAARYRTPYFDNLKHYAQKPVGTFHALPVARGKSIFKSNWIRDMGEFYGANLFLAESSATTGGLDSLLEPTGNIKDAQELAARALGSDRTFFVTNGTSTSNKIVHQALLRPGDIVLIDRDCHKSHHYGLVLAGGQPYYIDAYPLTKYSMYGSLAIKPIKQALLQLKAEGKLDKVRLLVITNCTFDGHMANVKRTMEECLAIHPDLCFLWDEAWSAFARFSPWLRPRTAMGAVAALRADFQDPAYRKRYEAQQKEIGKLEPKNKKAMDAHLLPDPDRARLRVYQTTSVHKSMSSLRQGSSVQVADQDWHTVEESFKEAFFTHTSTSPNLQIIASLDVARRQMELEGYELVQRAIQLSLELRRTVAAHPLISKYFRILTSEDMIPAEYRQSGIKNYGRQDGGWSLAWKAMREDEFFLDPTRVTLVCGYGGFDGTQFKGLLARKYDIQINKTSRNSVLVQLNINNTRSDIAHLIKVLADIARRIDKDLATNGKTARDALAARVKSLMDDVPDLPNFSHFHDHFRDNPKSETAEGHLREAYYTAYNAASCEHVKLFSKEIDDRLAKGPELISASFVIPYPPGFPIMVPGQVITKEIITFMRKLDVKEIHGYNAGEGLKLIKPSALKKAAK